jgi:excisionase family DNA binding protein
MVSHNEILIRTKRKVSEVIKFLGDEGVTAETASAILGMNVSTFYKMVKKGKIVGWYVGIDKTGIRFSMSEIKKYKRNNSTKK